MREIKFRAWIINEVKLVAWDDWDQWPWLLWAFEYNDREQGVVFEQYTGLKDKNGKEIYEGDILEHDETGERGAVAFELGYFYCEIGLGTDFYKAAYRHLEVIGNIHEHVLLLADSSSS
jgi:hypothetical protein